MAADDVLILERSDAHDGQPREARRGDRVERPGEAEEWGDGARLDVLRGLVGERVAIDETLNARYPYYRRACVSAAAAALDASPVGRSLATARRAINGLSVTIDARCLGPVVMGTQVHTLEVITALANSGSVELRVIVPPDLGSDARRRLDELEPVTLLAHTDIHPRMEKTTVAHRPYQVSNANDLLMLRCSGERTVITHQDLIAFRNPGYFPGYPQWSHYRRLTRQALAIADAVVFISKHAAADALREDLVTRDRVRIAHNGVDHATRGQHSVVAPPGAERLGRRPALLCLGTDLRHKNRLFALALLEQLRDRMDWDGELVLAGPHVRNGSSAEEEAAFLAARPELREHVVDLGAVDEREKGWLLERSAVLYPSTYEGFGLMPFEAAAAGRPCLFAPQTALAEILPAETAVLVPWSGEASGERVLELLSDDAAASRQVETIRAAGEQFTWQACAESLLDIYATAAGSACAARRRAGRRAGGCRGGT